MDLFQSSSAELSACGRYRYLLKRVWDDRLPPYVSGMLNPSTADAEINDATIVRNIRRAERLGCGSLIVWNLFAFRATDPLEMKAASDPVGPDNDWWIDHALLDCRERMGIAVAGWGMHGKFRDRAVKIAQRAAQLKVPLFCLGTTKEGHPRHPLYVGNSVELELWPRLEGLQGKGGA